LARVDRDVRYERAVEEGPVAGIGITRLARSGVGDGRTEISVAVADLDDRRIVAVDGDGRRGRGGGVEAEFCVTDSGGFDPVAGLG